MPHKPALRWIQVAPEILLSRDPVDGRSAVAIWRASGTRWIVERRRDNTRRTYPTRKAAMLAADIDHALSDDS